MIQKISKNINNLMLWLINSGIKTLSRIELRLGRNDNPNPLDYDDLTPTSRGDEDKKYSNVLEWALKNDNIKNIALTGSYGSGKSSIIKTFINEHRGYKTLNISLASFSDNDLSEDNDVNRLLELSILQQMFYHVKHSQIPDSRFKRIRSLNTKTVIFKSLLFITWLLSTVMFFRIQCITSSFLWGKYNLDNNLTISLISFGVFVLGVIYIIYKAIRISNNSKLNKLNVQSGEIEISNGVDLSILNKHLDEILYFFEVTRFDIVIFEDLDRFNNTEIFTKLRELNILVNHSKQINKRIVFLYAIKDDMFQDKERTKFFDFIIPIIPIVNTSNSGEMLLRKLTKANLINEESKDSLSIDFISDVSMYIEDMRLLKNIYNEYTIYKAKLDTKLNQNNLLAMIIYKNIFPSDFVDLHNDKGNVHSIFRRKTELIHGLINKNNEDIRASRKEVQQIENITIKNIQELRAIYIEAIIEQIPNANSIEINDSLYEFKQVKNDDNFSLLTECSTIKYGHYTYNTYYRQHATTTTDSGLSFESIENDIDSEQTYEARENLIIQKENNKIESLKQKIETLEKEKLNIKSYSILQIADKIETSTIFKDIEKEKLIIYLIRNGYLNENYHDYISYFYDALITKDDRDFLFSIKNRDALDSNFKLTKIENLIKKVKTKEFEYKESLNCNLLEFLLINREKYNEQYNTLLLQICNKSRASLLFIDSFLENGINTDVFIRELCSEWKSFWSYFVATDYSDEKKDIYLKAIITHLDIAGLKAQNAEKTLSDYIAKKNDFLPFVSDMDAEKINSILKELNIKFSNLEQPINGCRIFDFIYQNDLYRINNYMIRLILTEKGNIDNQSSLESANYTAIISSECGALLKYINNNIQDYISNVFLQLPNNTNESKDTIILMLNNEDIKIEYRTRIIDISENKIQALSTIKNQELIEHLLETSKVVASWDNIAHYYVLAENSINEILSSFINELDNYSELSKIKIKESLGDENSLVSKLNSSLIINDNINDACFKSILPCCNYMYTSLDFADLSENKIELLIQQGYFELSLERYSYIKENFNMLHIKLLTKYIKEFTASEDNYSFDENDLWTLLASKAFTIPQKINIVLTSDLDVIINSKRLCSEISNYLSKNQYIELDYTLLLGIITNAQSIENKIRLLNIHFDYLTEDNISELLTSLGYPYADIAIRGKKPSLPINETTLVFVEKLTNSNYISSFKNKDDKIKIYTKMG